MTTAQTSNTAEAENSPVDQTEPKSSRRSGPAVGAAVVGLGSALVLAWLAPAWLAYTVVALVALWLFAVTVDLIKKRARA